MIKVLDISYSLISDNANSSHIKKTSYIGAIKYEESNKEEFLYLILNDSKCRFYKSNKSLIQELMDYSLLHKVYPNKRIYRFGGIVLRGLKDDIYLNAKNSNEDKAKLIEALFDFLSLIDENKKVKSYEKISKKIVDELNEYFQKDEE